MVVTVNAKLVALALAAVSAAAAFSAGVWRNKWRNLLLKVRALESSLEDALEKSAAERQGRIRAQQDLRKALVEQGFGQSKQLSYPMMPIGTVWSCFSTRNGTPRQPLLIPLARACLVFDSNRVAPGALEGLTEYSHCWILYVFHLNTDLEKLWKQPYRSKLKAKVRVPRLKGGKIGVLATRSPHRSCPIGLTVAKIEAVKDGMILFSGVDLVDGTPVLDVKPYLPYSDSIQGAEVPTWVKVDNLLTVASIDFAPNFHSMLCSCWATTGANSLYASPDEFLTLIKQVLSWDIRSVSQRLHPRNTHKIANQTEEYQKAEQGHVKKDSDHDDVSSRFDVHDVIYHLNLEGVDVSYRIDSGSKVIVEEATLSCPAEDGRRKCCSYAVWRSMLAAK